MKINLPNLSRPTGRRRAPVRPGSSKYVRFESAQSNRQANRKPLGVMQIAILNAIVLVAAFLGYVGGYSHIFHLISQQHLRETLTESLQQGTGITGETDFQGYLVPDGTPIALIKIKKLKINEVVVEGTDSTTLRLGPGHRRDTVLPGQYGNSVIMGRATAFGGPFSRIQSLNPGDKFTVTTAQGVQYYTVIGVREAGDYAPPTLTAGESRLTLLSARGAPYSPAGLIRVDAELYSAAHPAGPRYTSMSMLPAESREMGIDFRSIWQLLLALQFLLLAEIGCVWAVRRFGLTKAWVAGAPTLLLALVLVMDQVARLLPNLI